MSEKLDVRDSSTVKFLKSRAKKHLMIDDLPNDKTIYVYNNIKGDYCMTVYPGNSNRSILLHIPETWIPRPITNLTSPTVLKESEQFRQALDKGILELVDTKEAKQVLETKEAKLEIERLRKRYSNIEYDDLIGQDNNVINAMKDSFSEVDSDIKNALSRDDIDEDEKLALLYKRSMQQALTDAEIDFIISVSEETYPSIYNWAISTKQILNKEQ